MRILVLLWLLLLPFQAFPATLEDITYRETIGSANNIGDIPAGTASGDGLVAWVVAGDNASITTPTGWTLRQSEDPGFSPEHWLYTRIADGTEGSTVTFVSTLTTFRHIVAIARVSGIDAYDTSSDTAADSSGTSHVSNGLTTAGDNQIVLLFLAQTQPGASFAPAAPSGSTLDAEFSPSNFIGVAAASFTQASAGATGTRTWTAVISGEFRSSAAVTFTNASGGGATIPLTLQQLDKDYGPQRSQQLGGLLQ